MGFGENGIGRNSLTLLSAHWVLVCIDGTPRAQKIRRPSSGGGKFRGDFSFGRSLSRTSTFAGQGTLPSPTTGCRIRFPESLLMLKLLKQRWLFVQTPRPKFTEGKSSAHRPDRQLLCLALAEDVQAHTIVDVWELYDCAYWKSLTSSLRPCSSRRIRRAVSSLMGLLNYLVGTSPNIMLATIDSATNFSSSEFYLYVRVPAHTSPSSSPSNHSLSCLIRASVSPA